MSNYYRLMNRRGGYTWMQLCATLVCNSKNSDEQSIICVNYVLSGSQYSSVVMDKEQVDQPSVRIKPDEDGSEVRNGSPESVKGEKTCCKVFALGESLYPVSICLINEQIIKRRNYSFHLQ